jgi:hypothetical protein
MKDIEKVLQELEGLARKWHAEGAGVSDALKTSTQSSRHAAKVLA